MRGRELKPKETWTRNQQNQLHLRGIQRIDMMISMLAFPWKKYLLGYFNAFLKGEKNLISIINYFTDHRFSSDCVKLPICEFITIPDTLGRHSSQPFLLSCFKLLLWLWKASLKRQMWWAYWKTLTLNSSFYKEMVDKGLEQGSQTCSPRAKCGRQGDILRPLPWYELRLSRSRVWKSAKQFLVTFKLLSVPNPHILVDRLQMK